MTEMPDFYGPVENKCIIEGNQARWELDKLKDSIDAIRGPNIQVEAGYQDWKMNVISVGGFDYDNFCITDNGIIQLGDQGDFISVQENIVKIWDTVFNIKNQLSDELKIYLRNN